MKKRTKRRYHETHGCYAHNGEFRRVLKRKYLGANIRLRQHKTAILMMIREEHGIIHESIDSPVAWLRPGDIDELVAMLKEAKAAWIKDNEATARLLAKQAKTVGK